MRAGREFSKASPEFRGGNLHEQLAARVGIGVGVLTYGPIVAVLDRVVAASRFLTIARSPLALA